MKNFLKFLFSDSTVRLIILSAFVGVIFGGVFAFATREISYPDGGADPLSIIIIVVTSTVLAPVVWTVTAVALNKWAHNKPLVDDDKTWGDGVGRNVNNYSHEVFNRKKYGD